MIAVLDRSKVRAAVSAPWQSALLLSCILALLTVICLTLYLKRRRFKSHIHRFLSAQLHRSVSEEAYEGANPAVTLSESELCELKLNRNYFDCSTVNDCDDLEFSRNNLTFHSDLLNGEHSRVFLAKVRPKQGEEQGRLVVVKMADDGSEGENYTGLVEEATTLKQLGRHPQIVQLLGAFLSPQPGFLVLEHLPFGDLKHFLRACSPNEPKLRLGLHSVEYDRRTLSVRDLIGIGQQLAEAAGFVNDRGWVHRDLAARNCLVGVALKIKLADFGLCRKLDSNGFFHGSENDSLPTRWLPPESIQHQHFSRKTDVWSFAVVLWEIFAFAIHPYCGLSSSEAINFVDAGQRLMQPPGCPHWVYTMMALCWQANWPARPSFDEIRNQFHAYFRRVRTEL